MTRIFLVLETLLLGAVKVGGTIALVIAVFVCLILFLSIYFAPIYLLSHCYTLKPKLWLYIVSGISLCVDGRKVIYLNQILC